MVPRNVGFGLRAHLPVALLIGVGSRCRSARQAVDLPSDGGVNLGRLFTVSLRGQERAGKFRRDPGFELLQSVAVIPVRDRLFSLVGANDFIVLSTSRILRLTGDSVANAPFGLIGSAGNEAEVSPGGNRKFSPSRQNRRPRKEPILRPRT